MTLVTAKAKNKRRSKKSAPPLRQVPQSRSSRPRKNIFSLIRGYCLIHRQVAISTLKRLLHAPLNSLMTVTVIAIAIALPATLYLLIQNFQQLGTGWSGAPTISLFLTQGQSAKTTYQLAQRLSTWPEITHLNYTSPQQALAEFEQQLGLQDLQATLGENPLPGVLIAQIAAHTANDPAAAHQLIARLQQLPEVDIAQLDLEWLQRLKAIATLAKRGVIILASLLALGVILITGNTIRLAILNRQEEIRIVKLIGGTDAFVRRPFLYIGIWYGLSGGLLACLILTLTLKLLSDPIDRLTHLYNSHFMLISLNINSGLHLCLIATSLGLGGAYLAVARHLKAIEST